MTESSASLDTPRVARSVLGWLASWGYVLCFLPVYATTATQYSDDAWSVSMFAALVIGGISLSLIYFGRSHPAWARWLAVPHFLIAIAGLGAVIPTFTGSTLAGHHLAAIALGSPEQTDIATPLWHRLYALVHVTFFASVIWLALRPSHRPDCPSDRFPSPEPQI
jgi:hypothetical protein